MKLYSKGKITRAKHLLLEIKRFLKGNMRKYLSKPLTTIKILKNNAGSSFI